MAESLHALIIFQVTDYQNYSDVVDMIESLNKKGFRKMHQVCDGPKYTFVGEAFEDGDIFKLMSEATNGKVEVTVVYQLGNSQKSFSILMPPTIQ